MSLITLFGTDHRYQCGGDSCTPTQIEATRQEILSCCIANSIKRISEEMTTDGRINYRVTETIGSKVARELGIEHQDVDLSIAERTVLALNDSTALNIKNRIRTRDAGGKLFRVFEEIINQTRERVWIARILAGQRWPVLFILGANHLVAVERILKRLGASVDIAQEDYAP